MKKYFLLFLLFSCTTTTTTTTTTMEIIKINVDIVNHPIMENATIGNIRPNEATMNSNKSERLVKSSLIELKEEKPSKAEVKVVDKRKEKELFVNKQKDDLYYYTDSDIDEKLFVERIGKLNQQIEELKKSVLPTTTKMDTTTTTLKKQTQVNFKDATK